MKKFLDIWTAEKIAKPYEELTRNAIDEYTAERLKSTLKYAAENSMFYREKYGDALTADFYNATGRDFFEAFAKLPFTTPDDLRNHETELLCMSPNRISRIVTLDTGGTTGKPKRIYFTEADQQLTVDFFRNGMQLIVDKSDCVLILMPARIEGSIGRLLAEALQEIGVKTVAYGLPGFGNDGSSDEAAELIDIIKSEGVTSAVAMPTHMKALAGATAGTVSLNSILLSAEYVADADMKLLKNEFGCKVYEHYGMTEMGLGCAVSCGYGEGYHIRESDLYIKITDPETGEKTPDGQEGEIVFTTLTREGMPFIRYRTGDISRFITEQCGCGSILKRLAKVNDRKAVKGYLR